MENAALAQSEAHQEVPHFNVTNSHGADYVYGLNGYGVSSINKKLGSILSFHTPERIYSKWPLGEEFVVIRSKENEEAFRREENQELMDHLNALGESGIGYTVAYESNPTLPDSTLDTTLAETLKKNKIFLEKRSADDSAEKLEARLKVVQEGVAPFVGQPLLSEPYLYDPRIVMQKWGEATTLILLTQKPGILGKTVFHIPSRDRQRGQNLLETCYGKGIPYRVMFGEESEAERLRTLMAQLDGMTALAEGEVPIEVRFKQDGTLYDVKSFETRKMAREYLRTLNVQQLERVELVQGKQRNPVVARGVQIQTGAPRQVQQPQEPQGFLAKTRSKVTGWLSKTFGR